MSTEFDYEEIRREHERAPRNTSLLRVFEGIASGQRMMPSVAVKADPKVLGRSTEYERVNHLLKRNEGRFYPHACASIPFILEEKLRLIMAFSRFFSASIEHKAYRFWETSSADGTLGRTLAEYCNGRVYTLSDSPNSSNMQDFERLKRHNFSFFHLGPFVDITPGFLHLNYPQFVDGFDVIWENTTFQMYGPDRVRQIAYIKRVLKPQGLVVFQEKMNHEVRSTYELQERLKNEVFKPRYFTEEQISEKNNGILMEMERGQTTLREFISAAQQHFRFLVLTWNCGNFYQIVASNDFDSVQRFVSGLDEPFVPKLFQVEKPRVLCGRGPELDVKAASV